MLQTLFGVGKIEAKPGNAEDLESALLEVVLESRKEPGNLHFDLYRGDPTTDLFIIEQSWVSLSALQAHFATEYVRRFISRAESLAVAPLELTTLSAVNRV